MIWIYISINFIILLLAFWTVKTNTKLHNIPFIVCLLLLFIYCVLTPTYFYITERKTVLGDEGLYKFVGKDLTNYYEKGMFFYMLCNAFFVAGFMWKRYRSNNTLHQINSTELPALRRKSLYLYLFFFAIVVGDIAISGINPVALLMGDSDENLFGHQSITNSYYFRNCADCIISAIILYAYLKGKAWKLGILIIPAFILFAIMGFRYRIIATIIGLILIYSANSFSSFTLRRWAFIGISAMYFIFFITYNRWNFIAGRFDDLAYNPYDFNYEVFFEQTHQSLADFNLIRYYEENPNLDYDYGLTMFGYIFIKAIPKFFFKNGEKPYPPPALDLLNDSLELPRQWARTGEALMHYGEFYETYGLMGAIILPFLMGFLVHYFSNNNPSYTPYGLLVQIALSLALFVFITRGYFPQFVDNFVYMSFPIWLMKKSLKRATIALT